MDAFIVYPNALSCLGYGEELWRRLCAGECGLSEAKDIYPDWFPDNTSKIGAIRGLSQEQSRLGQILKLMDRYVISEHIESCQLILGASSLGDLTGEFAGDPHACMTDFLQNHHPELASRFNGVISSACSSGTDVLSLAAMLVNAGKYDIVGVLAADCLDPGKLLQHFSLGTQSGDCAKPFDARRDGTSFGEGGGFAIVANRQGLQQLPATPAYRIAGFGFSCDAMHITAPDESGEIPSLAMSRALDRALHQPSDIAYINAHASGTPINDQVENLAFSRVFGESLSQIAVSGTKGAIGHLLGSTGLVEAILTCWSLADHSAPGTIGLSNLDGNLSIQPKPGGKSHALKSNLAMSTTFGFGGVNSAIVIESQRM